MECSFVVKKIGQKRRGCVAYGGRVEKEVGVGEVRICFLFGDTERRKKDVTDIYVLLNVVSVCCNVLVRFMVFCGA